jgi:uncharacterized protein YyaL (SSP411 family)
MNDGHAGILVGRRPLRLPPGREPATLSPAMSKPAPMPPGPTDAQRTNRLARETSAYLRQHQHNPVDWLAWGPEAFERARAENRPILVSIGYSACHWCHVMERESFEDPEIAALMNAAFVNIKVDREERPDVDQIYMDASLKLNGAGGWPLNAVCTPDGRPFFVGTYFPPTARGDMPAWRDVVEALARAWREQPDQVEHNASQIAEALLVRPEGEARLAPSAETVRRAARTLMENADTAHGGFGSAPKFPTPANLEFLIAALDFLPPDEARSNAQFLALTAREMSRRGLFDQIGGGFHRYCVDANWTIPHFEKMLYDQGQLLSFYAELGRRSHEASDLVWAIRETVDYLRREMRAADGAFHASQDADSEGEEGRFFVWTPAQIDAVLGEASDAFKTAYGVRPSGNFENGTSQLVDEARQKRSEFEGQRRLLLEARSARIAPATDPKHVAAWNAYTISGLARSASLLGDASMLEDAVQCADFVLREMRDDSGRLLRIHDQGRAHVPGFLDDHAALLTACLDLQRAGAGDRFLEEAQRLGTEILERFADTSTGALYLAPRESDDLIHRPRSEHDGATPDAAGLALLGLTRLASLGGLSHAEAFERFIELALADQAFALEQAPHAFPTLLRAVALRSRGLSVAVIIGSHEAPETRALAARARRVLLPEDAVLVRSPDDIADDPADKASRLVSPSWFEGREAIEGRPTAYLCRGHACSLPVQDPAKLIADLTLTT